MKRFGFGGLVLLGFVVLCSSIACSNGEKAGPPKPVRSGEYFGQEPPGMTAELFGEGILSTGMYELNAVFFPGGKEVIFSVTTGPMQWALVMAKEEGGRWAEPEVAPFSGRFGGVDPCVSFDGRTVYFCSNRPRSGSGGAEEDYDIWAVTRVDSGWSEPVNLGQPVNTETHEFYPALTRDGILYFQSRREGGLGGADIYRAVPENGRFARVEHLPEPVNSRAFEGDAFIAPDESYIIVSTVRVENIGQSDLYISFKEEDGSWTPMQNLGPEINSPAGENCQVLSPCGRYLFFTSRRYRGLSEGVPGSYEAVRKRWADPQNGGGDAYWIDARFLERFRPEKNEIP
jgi:hypothetical protein